MLSNTDFEDWCHRLNLSDEARTLIHRIRESPPARAVRSSKDNVSGRYPSRKMGVTIQFESHKNELAFIYEYEHNDDVLEYYDQPCTIKLEYEAANERRLGVLHTPDFFNFRSHEAGWEECKLEEHLNSLSSKSPNRYVRDAEGKWRCPPGEAYAEKFGLYYRVRSSKEINWTYLRNIEFLDDYFRADTSILISEDDAYVLTHIKNNPGITLQDLLRHIAGKVRSDVIFALIANDNIHVDLYAAPLAEPKNVHIFPDQDTANAYTTLIKTFLQDKPATPTFLNLKAGTSIQWGSNIWVIVNVDEAMVGLVGEGNNFVEVPTTAFENLVQQGRITSIKTNASSSIHSEAQIRFKQADQRAYAEANRRYEIVQSYLSGNPLPANINTPARTLRFWVNQYRRAQEVYGTGYVGLLPRPNKGNPAEKLPSSTRALIDEFIESDYETIKQKRKYEVYAAFLLACQQRGVIPASYKTFCTAVKRRPQYRQTLKRQGTKAAYKEKEFYWELSSTTPRHGERPFHITHIDHTELDIELICSMTGQNLGRPWATFLTDAFSRRIIAISVSYDRPSYRSCMVVMRECVRRFGRFPQIIIVDGGLELSGTYFETLLARYKCTKKTRPPAESRFGSVCERLFGTTNTRFIHTLQGNTQIMRNVRQVTKSINPREHAIWTLGRLYIYLCEWAYEVYDTIEHPALGQSPRDAFAAGLLRAGERSSQLIPYDDDFRMFTFPTTPKTTAKVQPGQGVKVRNIYYWSDAFRNPAVERTQVPVRYDPFDAGLAFAYVLGQWVECHSEWYSVFHNRSERELVIATTELRQRQTRHSRQLNITATKLAQFLESVEAEELLLRQSAIDRETRNTLTLIDGGFKSHAPNTTSQLNSSPTMPHNATEAPSKLSVRLPDPSKLESYGEF